MPQQFLDRTQRIRLRRLLDMMYSPADLARELKIDQRDVYRRWLPAGIPHVRDDKGHVLLHGLTIAKWFDQQKPKRNIKSDEGYCLKCKAVVKLIDPELVQHGKFHLLRAPAQLANEWSTEELNMINRDNYKAMCGYLRYEAEVPMRDDTTLERHESMLKHVLRWLDNYSLNNAPDKRPVFALYLVNTGCVDGTESTEIGIKRICREARTFFTHLLIQYPRQYRTITPAWIDTLRPPKLDPEIPEERVVLTLKTLQQVNQLKSEDLTLAEWRDKAAGCFLFLSAMRATAFVTMPIRCFNFQTRIVKQFPKLGVRTKNRKSKETHLLEIPDLLEEVRSWDCFVREHLPETAPWYPVIDISLGQQVPTANAPGKFRAKSLSDNLKALFERAGLEPMSPHKFRHGHAVYAMKQAKSIADLKALSQNMMHESIGTTEIIYGKSPDKEMQERIARLGQSNGSNVDTIAAL